MKLALNNNEPIFVQIARFLEDAIIEGYIEEEGQVPSTTEFSKTYAINPATVLKGMNLLVDEGIIYKKRGIGMFVSTGAKIKIAKRRKETFTKVIVADLLREAKKLGISKNEIIEAIMKEGNEGCNP